MFQPHANTAASADPATRIEFASRRQPRTSAATNEEPFSAILDRTSAQRSEALRQLRVSDAPEGDAIAARTGDAGGDPIAGTSPAKPEPVEPRMQLQTKPQRPAARNANSERGGNVDGEATAAPASPAPENAHRTEVAAGAKPDMVADTTTQAPAVATPESLTVQPASPIAVPVPPSLPPAPIAMAQPAMPQHGIGGPTPPANVAPIAGPPVPDAVPLPLSGPSAPAELAMPMPAPIAGAAPTMPRTEAVAPMDPSPGPAPVPAPAPASAQQVPAGIAQKQTDGAYRPDAAVQKPTPDAAEHRTTTTQTTAPMTSPATPSAMLDQAQPRVVVNPAATIAAAPVAAVALAELAQPQRLPTMRTDASIGAGQANDDTTIDIPLPATATRAAPAADAGSAAREPTNRGGANMSNAFAAQLAQQDDGLQPVVPPAAQAVTPTPIETPGRTEDSIKPRAATQDEVAPVRNAIVVAPEVAAARIESTSESLATRAARMPMHPAVAQVAVSVTKAVQEGVDRITIKLQPPELGRIDVRLEVGVDGRIQAVFAAERPATVEILQRDVRELERALQNAGLSTDAGGLSFGLKQNGGQNGAFSAFERSLGNGVAPAADEETVQSARPRRAAVDGRLDIHV